MDERLRVLELFLASVLPKAAPDVLRLLLCCTVALSKELPRSIPHSVDNHTFLEDWRTWRNVTEILQNCASQGLAPGSIAIELCKALPSADYEQKLILEPFIRHISPCCRRFSKGSGKDLVAVSVTEAYWFPRWEDSASASDVIHGFLSETSQYPPIDEPYQFVGWLSSLYYEWSQHLHDSDNFLSWLGTVCLKACEDLKEANRQWGGFQSIPLLLCCHLKTAEGCLYNNEPKVREVICNAGVNWQIILDTFLDRYHGMRLGLPHSQSQGLQGEDPGCNSDGSCE